MKNIYIHFASLILVSAISINAIAQENTTLPNTTIPNTTLPVETDITEDAEEIIKSVKKKLFNKKEKVKNTTATAAEKIEKEKLVKLKTPKVKTPKVKVPKVKTPKIKTPKVKVAKQVKMPNATMAKDKITNPKKGFGAKFKNFFFPEAEPVVVAAKPSRVKSKRMIAENGDLFLMQEMIINAPIEKVWEINTTPEGWKKWVCPIVEFKLGIGDTIKTSYQEGAIIGDTTTNYITIENYVPYETITLKSVLGKAWPDYMQRDGSRFYNVINFIKINDRTTKLVSYGIGYRNTTEYLGIIDYIDFMNIQSYEKMIEILENEQKNPL